MVTLNASYPSSATAHARWKQTLAHGGRSRVSRYCALANREAAMLVYQTPATLRAPTASSLASPRATGPVLDTRWLPHHQPSLHRRRSGQPSDYCVYTDGSTGPVPGRPSGCAVVVVEGSDKDDAVVLEHGFAVRASGNNYLSELTALVSALTVVPEDANLHVRSDALSVRDALLIGRDRDTRTGEAKGSYSITQRKRILSAARPTMNLARALICARSGRTTISHVRAHTGGADVGSLLNEAADRVANAARIRAAGSSPPHELAGEEKMSMMVRGVRVVGSYRQHLQRELDRKALQRWALLPHQGKLARQHGARLLSLLDTVSRRGSPAVRLALTLLVTRWLPTEERLASSARVTNNDSRGATCKLCGAALETNRHAILECPHPLVRAARDSARRHAHKTLYTATQLPTARDWDPRQGVAGSPQVIPAWWDPSGHSTFGLYPLLEPSVVAAIRNHDRYAGFIGILPPRALDALQWVHVGRGRWVRLSLSAAKARCCSLQMVLAARARDVWTTRCRAMDAWWRSQSAAPMVTTRSDNLSARRIRKALLRERRASVNTPRTTVIRKGRIWLIGSQRRGLRRSPRSTHARQRRHTGPEGFFVRGDAELDAAGAGIAALIDQGWNRPRPRLAWY